MSRFASASASNRSCAVLASAAVLAAIALTTAPANAAARTLSVNPATGLLVPSGVTVQGATDNGFPAATLLGQGSGAGLRLAGSGSIVLVSGRSRVTHQGKTATAHLAIKLPRSLAGRTLRLAVQAADRHRHRQLDPRAGVIHVAR
jgi:hypothetical protein